VPTSKGISMFEKVPIKRTKLYKPDEQFDDKDSQLLKPNYKRKTLESSDAYSEDFENDESSAKFSFKKKNKSILKSDIEEEIPEEYEEK
jgi:hypothetical protein